MDPAKPPQRSSLGLIVLGLLFEGPLHVYAMQKRIEAYGKNRVVNVKARASLYQTLDRLHRLGLVEIRETVRREGYPDRIIYAMTDAGHETAQRWLREMLCSTGGEYPEFIAAVSMMFGLEPDDARRQLQQRAEQLAAELADTEAQLSANPDLPRLFLLEEEYRCAILQAELDWVRGVVSDIGQGRLTWSEQWLRGMHAELIPPHDDEEQPA